MKKHILFNGAVVLGLILALAVLPAGAWSMDKEKIEQKIQKTETLEKGGKVVLRNVSGSVEIHGWAESQVKIDALKTSRGDTKEKAQANADLVTVDVVKTGNILRIETRYPEGRKHNNISVSVDYKVWVPLTVSVDFRNVSGDAIVDGLAAGLRGEVTSGELKVSKIVGETDCSVISGDLDVLGVEGDVSLKVVSGEITARQIKGSIEAETTSGSIILKNISGARSARVKALSGNVNYDGGLDPAGRYSFEAFSGNVTVLIPAASAFEFEAGTFSGGIESDFPVTVTGKISNHDMRGTVNGGGATLKLKTFSGSIGLRKK